MARLIQKGDIIDYENKAAGTGDAVIPAGKVLNVGGFVGVVQNDIGIGEWGSVAITGVWEVEIGEGTSFEQGAAVYWDATNGVAVASGGAYMGRAWAATAEGDTAVKVRLEPAGESAGE